MHRAALLLLLGGLTPLCACGSERGGQPAGAAAAAVDPAADPAKPAEAAAPARPPRPPAEPLTQEELDLIAANPAELTPELRRKRAFALRKKIMQNPDSPAAKSLEETRLAIERGELTPQLPDQSASGLRLEARVPGHPESSIPDPDAPPHPPAPAP